MNTTAYPAGLSSQSALLNRTLAINAGRTPTAPGAAAADQPGLARAADRATTIDLSGLFAKLRSSLASRAPSPFAGVQRDVDGITTSIRSVLNASNGSGPNNVGVVNVASALVSNYQFGSARLAPGERVDVDVTIVSSAEQGALYVSMTGGRPAIDVQNADNLVTFEIFGSKGRVEITFESGATVADIAAAINIYTPQTGVVASAEVGGGRGGVFLASNEYGNDEFVGVRSLSGPVFGVPGTGVFDIDVQFDFSGQDYSVRIDRDSRYRFNDPLPRVDRGEDVFALVNGQYSVGVGATVFFETPKLSGVLDLFPHDQSGRPNPVLIGGRFTAMTLVGGTGAGIGGVVDQGTAGGRSGPTNPAGTRPAFNQII